MSSVLISEICDGVADTLRDNSDIVTVQSYNELQESLNRADLPLCQVYWENIRWSETGDTDRATFGGGVRVKVLTVHIDYYSSPRSHLNENMGGLVEGVDSIIDTFEQENTRPFFGVQPIKSFDLVSMERVVFEYTAGQSPVYYIGARTVLNVWIY